MTSQQSSQQSQDAQQVYFDRAKIALETFEQTTRTKIEEATKLGQKAKENIDELHNMNVTIGILDESTGFPDYFNGSSILHWNSREKTRNMYCQHYARGDEDKASEMLEKVLSNLDEAIRRFESSIEASAKKIANPTIPSKTMEFKWIPGAMKSPPVDLQVV